MNSKMLLHLITAVTLTSLSALAGDISDSQWEKLKQQALERKRRIVYNTDGCDAVYFPRDLQASKDNFIKQRLIYALGSKIDTISYCPLSSGFGYLTSKTKVGDQLIVDPPHAKNKRNVTKELLALETDPLKITEEFCRKNNFEFFVSLRCNDTHDSSHRKEKPYFLFPPYKEKHMELLLGSYSQRPPHCSWSAVDFTHKEIREHFLSIIRELITNYEVDGLELDFCRHMQYFKSVAWGGKASEKELEMMNNCMRKIRAMAEEIGRERKRPIIIAVRLPDSAEYSKAAGLDVKQWMKEKLIDIYIGSFYFRLNPWEKSVKLCKKYSVKFYASMDESRIYKTSSRFKRNDLKTYRARQAAALQAGVDGIYYFNLEGSSALRNTMRGNLDDIRFDDKKYFISYRYRFPGTYLKNGEKHNNLKELSPHTPALIQPGRPQKFMLEIGDDFSIESRKNSPVLKAYADIDAEQGKRLVLKLNGQELPKLNSTSFAVPLNIPKVGENKLEIEALPASSQKTREVMIMSGEKLLRGKSQAPWRRVFDVHDYQNSEKIIDGAYRIKDSGTKSTEFANLIYPLINLPSENCLKVKFQAKVENSNNPLAVACRIANGSSVEIISLQPDRINLYFSGKSVKFATADKFHDYYAIMNKDHLILKVDGKEIFNLKLKMCADNPAGHLKGSVYTIPNMHRQSLLFGSLSGKGTGSALWKNIYIIDNSDKIRLRDLRFELNFDQTAYLDKYSRHTPNWGIVLDASQKISARPKVFKNTYRSKDLSVIENKTGSKYLLLKTSNPNETIQVIEKNILNTNKGILLAEWKIKQLERKPEKGTFMWCVRFKVTSGETIIYYVKLYPEKVDLPWGSIELDKNTNGKWLKFRTALDLDKKTAMLWLNNKKIAAGNVSCRTGVKPGIFIGGGTASVNGTVELEYVKFKVID